MKLFERKYGWVVKHDFHWKNMVNQSILWCFSGLIVYVVLIWVSKSSLFKNIDFVIKICIERNERIFCYKNQCASGKHTYISK